MTEAEKKKGGISIRVIHIAMIVCAVAIALLLVFTTVKTTNVFTRLNKETGNYIVRQKAAHGLMEASDYLTENVQRFTLEGDVIYLDNYFEEAFNSKRREAAITSMAENDADQALVQQLQDALNESMTLMYREYYAMKLVIEAKGIRDYPDTLKAIELKEEDTYLSAEEKMELAQEMVMGPEYYASKEVIRGKLNVSLDALEQQMNTTRQDTQNELMGELVAERVVVIVLTVILLVLIFLTAKLGTLPLMNAADHIRNRKELPVEGAREFRNLAENYNEMFASLHPENEADGEQGEAQDGEQPQA